MSLAIPGPHSRQVPGHRSFIALLLSRSTVHDLTGTSTRALADASLGLRIAGAFADRTAEADCLIKLSELFSSVSQYGEVMRTARAALDRYQETGDRQGCATALNNIGFVHTSLGEHTRALEFYGRSLALDIECGDRSGEAYSLNNIGNVHTSLGDHRRALEHYRRSLVIRKEIGDRAGQARCLNNIGACYDSLGEYPKALRYYQESYLIKLEIGDRRGQALSLNNIGYLHKVSGEYQQALECYQSSLRIRAGIGDRKGQADSINNIGVIYNRLGEQGRALDQYREALAIYDQIGDRQGQAYSLTNSAAACLEQGDPMLARVNVDRARRIAEEINSKELLRRAALTAGEIEFGLDRTEAARTHVWAALALAESLGSRAGRAEALLLLARLAAVDGNDDPVSRFQQALAGLAGAGDPALLARAQYHYAEFCIARGDLTAAALVLQQAREFCIKTGNGSLLDKVETLSRYQR